jgi:DNA-binding transcriptional LysR family regulator
MAAFDELKQGIRDIEFLSDPAVGEVRIGCDESIAAATLPLIIERFAREYPGVVLNVEDLGLRNPPNVRELGFTNLLAGGQFITAFANSVADFYAHRFGLKVLPVDLPNLPWPVVVMTVKHRTLSPVVTAFIKCARTVAKPLAKAGAD